jgi:hypothetical protein
MLSTVERQQRPLPVVHAYQTILDPPSKGVDHRSTCPWFSLLSNLNTKGPRCKLNALPPFILSAFRKLGDAHSTTDPAPTPTPEANNPQVNRECQSCPVG